MKLKYAIYILSCFFLFTSRNSFAQQQFLPLNHDFISLYDESLNHLNSNLHTSIRPYRMADILQSCNMDSVENTIYFNKPSFDSKLFNWAYRKGRTEPFLVLDSSSFNIKLDPLFQFQWGREMGPQRSLSVNTRGIQISGDLGKKFSFSTSFYENQTTFPLYVDTVINTNTVVPGQGMPKKFRKGFDYAFANGYISYTPSRFFNFQFGNDKNFIGEGYRSLLLSDNAFNYPFFKITTSFWKIRYMNLYAQFIDLNASHIFENGYRKKYGNFHYLDYNVSKRFSIGVFEALIWQNSDSVGGRGFEWGYLNPVIFYRPVEFSVGSPDNALMGMNLKFKINSKNLIYAQILLDEFLLDEIRSGKGWYANKQAFQFGMKNFNLFGINNLSFQSELNYVRPFTYSHERTITNYGHYNQSLAHTLNSNFLESISFLRYRYKTFFMEAKYMFVFRGNDYLGRNYGNNLYMPYHTANSIYGNYLGNGLQTNISLTDVRIVYLMNPKTNLSLELGVTNRISKDKINTNTTNIIYFGIRSTLQNLYYDF